MPADLHYDEARRRIAAAVEPLVETETVALADAVGRVLAADLVAGADVPPHDNAAMDGYALAVDDRTTDYALVGRAYAGHPHAGTVGRGECVRVTTGAVLPDGCDSVVPWEACVVDGDRVRPNGVVVRGQHRRAAGEDVGRGAVALERGRRLTPSDLGLAASIDRAVLTVVRRPRVAVLSTGDELQDPGGAAIAGGVRDSNRPALIALLRGLGATVRDCGIVADDADALRAALRTACDGPDAADVVVTSGGVSSGDADHTRTVLQALGSVDFWKLAIKPGRPLAFGRIASGDRTALLFGLPGNPVAAMVIFHALLHDALTRLMGCGEATPQLSLTAICETALPKAPGRTEFVRGIAYRDGAEWRVRTTGAQGSGILRSVSDANCLIVLDHDRGAVATGERVDAWPMRGLL